MIVLVTDSSAYIPKAEAKRLNVRIVPLTYTVAGKSHAESYSDCNGDFVPLLKDNKGCCHTAQAPSSAFAAVFSEILAKGDQVLCLVLSSRLSGTYAGAFMAARELKSPDVAVVDTLTTAGGLYMLLESARELADGGMPLKEIAEQMETLKRKVGIAFSVDSMEALRRSGRFGKMTQSVSTMLNIRPILLCDRGIVISQGFARGKSDRIKKLVGKIPQNTKEIVVHYLGAGTNVQPLLTAVKSSFSNIRVQLHRIGPVLSIHVGTGIIGVAWITE